MNHADGFESDENILSNDLLYEDSGERSRHMTTVKSLAKEINEPLSNVARTYEDILVMYKQEAVIQDFLPVLVSKKIKAFYRMQHM